MRKDKMTKARRDSIKSKKQMAIISFVCLLLIWGTIAVIDYRQVCHLFEVLNLFFAIGSELQKDGGSGLYNGFGYSFDIKGNFMPEDEFPGVIHVKYYLFGNMIEQRIRD